MNKDVTLFKDFWSDFPSIFEKRNSFIPKLSGELENILNGKCDFEELQDKYLIELEVPGVKKDEIQLSMNHDVLTVSWRRIKEEKKEMAKSSRYERSEGSFSRSFNVEGADSEKIDATLRDGVLKIVLSKNENVKIKKIEIN